MWERMGLMTHFVLRFHFVTRIKSRQSNKPRKHRCLCAKFRDNFVRFFEKNYMFIEIILSKTQEEKVSKKHDFKPFPKGLGLKTCFKFLHKKIEVTRFELATPWSQTRCSTKLSHTSEFLPQRKGTLLYYPKSEYFVNRIFRILIIKILKLFRKMEVEDWLLPPVFLLQLFLRNSLSNSFY